MIIAQISDSHIRAERAPLGPVDTAACLERAVAALNALDPQPAMVLLTGDIGNDGTAAEYGLAAEILRPLRPPLRLVPGNHDRRTTLRRYLPCSDYLEKGDMFQYVVAFPALRIVALDTLDEGSDAGMLCQERLGWLERALEAGAGKPTLIMMHHPAIETGIAYMDRIRLLEGAAAFAAIVRRHPEIERITCGHVHRAIERRFAGTVLGICPGIAHQLVLDLRSAAEPSFIAEPAGYQLHLVDDAGGITTHTAVIGEHGGPVTYASVFA